MIHPIILCGGIGSRLWPSSRQTFPKQFAPLLGDRSPYQDMIELFSGAGFDAPTVTTHSDFKFLANDQANDAGVWDARILVEPEKRDTAASVLSAVLMTEDDPDALILIAPVCHYAGTAKDFRAAIQHAAERVRKGAIVRFLDGMAEARNTTTEALAELVSGSSARHADTPSKPGTSSANALPGDNGMALFRRADLIAAFEAQLPEMLKACRNAAKTAKSELGFVQYSADAYSKIPALRFDADVLDKIKGTMTMPLGGRCSSLADWDAVWTVVDRDSDGVSTSPGAMAVDCRDSLLRCEEGSMQLLGIGLNNVVAVAMRDAVLVADRDHLAQIPGALERLEASGRLQAREYPRYHRPWGWYESLIARDRFQVKRIMVKPGGVLSLQSHVHRSEHWIVVGGTAKVTVDEEVKLVPENGSVYIPLGAVHRMANPGKVPMYLIEVQTGVYLGEDDIERYEDIYARC